MGVRLSYFCWAQPHSCQTCYSLYSDNSKPIMDEITTGSKAQVSVSLPSEPKCAVCDNLDVWPERSPREYRYKPPTTIDSDNLSDECGYCQLLKSSLIQLDLVPHDKSPVHVWTDDGRIRVNGGGFDEDSRWNVVIYTPFQVGTSME